MGKAIPPQLKTKKVKPENTKNQAVPAKLSQSAKRLMEQQGRLAEQVAHYNQVQQLYALKQRIADIARRVGITRTTVYRYLSMDKPPGPKQPNRQYGDLLAPYKPYLLKRWNEGCRNGHQLARELEARLEPDAKAPAWGTISRFMVQLRREQAQLTEFKPLILEDLTYKKRPLTARQAALLFVREPTQLREWEQEYLKRLCQLDAVTETVRRQVLGFTELVRQRQGQKLEEWVNQILAEPITEIAGFAKGLKTDWSAVQAGLTLPYSQGQTEGQVQKLKLLKRLAYGQAGFDLLRRLVLYRPKPRRGKL